MSYFVKIYNNINHKAFKNYFFILFAIILLLLFFYPIIFSKRTFFFRDIHCWFYPMKYYLASSLKNGSIPFWCPNYFCGSPFISDIQSGVFYPLSLVLLPFSFPWAFNLFILLHIFLGFCFFYLFIKTIGLSKQAALFTSISFSFGSYTIASINTLNNLTTIIWLPAILWSFTKGTRTHKKSWFFLTIIFMCLFILGGEPQIVIIGACLFIIFNLVYFRKDSLNRNQYIKLIFLSALIFSSALLITIVQLGPTFLDYQHSIRLDGLAYDQATRYSLNPAMLKHLIIPLTFQFDFSSGLDALVNFFPGRGEMPWLLTIYPGFLIVPFALMGLFSKFSKKRYIWFVIFIISLVLSLGKATPIYYVFYKFFPFFRFPEKFIFPANFSLLVMAAYGFDRVCLMIKSKTTFCNLFTFLITLLLIVDLFSAHKDINPTCESDFYQYYHSYLQPIIEDKDTFRVYLDPDIPTPQNLKHTIINHHIRWQMMLSPNLGILHNLDHVSGAPALELRYQYLIAEISEKSWEEKIRFLKLSNVKYIISSKALDKNPALKNHVQRVNSFVYRVNDHLPRAWTIGQLHQIEKGSIENLVNGSFDAANSALAKGSIANKYNTPSFEEIDDISYEKNSLIRIKLTNKKPGILVLSESSYPGWKVFVDGQEKECLWLDLLFQGVEIGIGSHKVEFKYRPKYFNFYLLISITSLLLFIFIYVKSIFSTRKNV